MLSSFIASLLISSNTLSLQLCNFCTRFIQLIHNFFTGQAICAYCFLCVCGRSNSQLLLCTIASMTELGNLYVSLLQLGDLQSNKYLKFSASGRLENKISAFGRCAYYIVCKWVLNVFAGCLPCSNGKDDQETMSAEELSGLRKVFDTFDANKDGFLTLEELCSWMNKLGLPSMTKNGLVKILQSCDWDHDGRLDFNEFVALTHTLHNNDNSGESSSNIGHSYLGTSKCSEDKDDLKFELKEAFEVFDKDGNGLISPTELRATLCELGLISNVSSISRIHSMIKKVDLDGDGQVSFSEFETMMDGKKKYL